MSAPSVSLADAHAAAERLMAAYPVTDLAETAQAAAAHLAALTGPGRPTHQLYRRGTRETLAMFGVAHAGALADLGRLGEATRALDAAEQHAFEAGHRDLAAWAAGTRAEGHLASGDPDTAIDVVAMALPLAKDIPASARLYAVAARAYALRGGHTEATSAIWLATASAEKHCRGDGVFGVPFRSLSPAEVAASAAETCTVLGNNRRAATLAEEWLPPADRAGHTQLRGHLRGARAVALARTEPEEAAALMAWLLTAASDLGEFGSGVHRKAKMFLDRAAPVTAVRDVAEMYRTLGGAAGHRGHGAGPG